MNGLLSRFMRFRILQYSAGPCQRQFNYLVGLGGGLPVLCICDRKANLTLLIDIGVVDSGAKRYPRRLERILCRKLNLDFESALRGKFYIFQVKPRQFNYC